MRFPIKLNRRYWPARVTALLPSAEDPRVLLDSNVSEEDFSKSVSVFQFGNTFKSTRAFRFPRTLDILKNLAFTSAPAILDIGASDGITSMHTIRTLPFRKYYVTDLNLDTLVSESGSVTYFYDQQLKAVLAVTDRFVVYADHAGALFPFNLVAPRFFDRVPPNPPDERILLINPSLQPPPEGVEIRRYDVFEPWPEEEVDLIIAANILNRAYFKDHEIRLAIGNMAGALSADGWLAVIDNRDREQSTVFQLEQGRFKRVHSIDGGTDIEDIVLSVEARCSLR